MGYSASEIIPRFVKYAGKEEDGWEADGKNGRLRKRFPDGSGSSLYYRTTGWRDRRVVEIVSYGSHFPLGRLALTKGGKRRLWVLNGDQWSRGGFGRTNEHNAMMREAAQASGTPWVILPFSALREAGIDPDTIRVVHQERERWEPEEHSAARLEDVPEMHRKRRTWKDATGAVIEPPRAADGTVASPDFHLPAGQESRGWHVYRRSALSGGENIPVPGPSWEGELSEAWGEITPGADGRYHWTEQRHWLGESVFRATYRRWNSATRTEEKRTRYFLSAFDTAEPRPLYFLAELPSSARPRTVEAAREALKPAAVVAAEAAGVTVQRQGDVFAIPQPHLATRELPGPSRRGALVLGVNHKATEVRTVGDWTYARGKLYHARRPAEHVTITLGDGKTWHLLARNTVPAFQQGGFTVVRAWSMGGRVD